MTRETYVFRDGQLVPKRLAAPRIERKGVAVVPDIKSFITQDGVEISSRSKLREYERKNGVRQIGNDYAGSEPPTWWDAYKRGAYRG